MEKPIDCPGEMNIDNPACLECGENEDTIKFYEECRKDA
jgi:hypothetical protein